MSKQAIDRTAYPDGTTIKYLKGMDAPVVKDMSDIMKESVMAHTNKPDCEIQQLTSLLQISG